MSTTTTRRVRDAVSAELAASGAMFPFTRAEFFAALASAGISESTLDALIAGTMVAVPFANAALIAAAPDLYDACNHLKAIHDDLAGRIVREEDTSDAFALWDEAIDAMEAALAKARGET